MAIPSFNLGSGKWASKENAILGYKQNSEGVYGAIEGDVTRASTKTRVNASGLIEEVPIGVASIDYLDSVNGALKCEPQSTNLFLYSEDFTDANYTKVNLSVNSNNVISPDGTQNADKIVENGTLNPHYLQQAESITATNNYTFSVFAKKGERNWVKLDSSSDANWSAGAFFDLENGVVGTIDSGTAKIEDYGNGWYRCSITGLCNITGIMACQIIMSTDGSTVSYTGDGTSGIYIWGAMFEQLSYPTSYIKTEAINVTRLADAIDDFGTANDFNSSEGVLYAEISALAENTSAREISISDGSSSNRLVFQYSSSSNNIVSFLNVSGTVQFVFIQPLISQSEFIKVAIKYKENDFAIYVNGSLMNTDVNGSTWSSGTLTRFGFDGGSGSGSNNFYGKVKDLRVYDTALTDAELTALTTL